MRDKIYLENVCMYNATRVAAKPNRGTCILFTLLTRRCRWDCTFSNYVESHIGSGFLFYRPIFSVVCNKAKKIFKVLEETTPSWPKVREKSRVSRPSEKNRNEKVRYVLNFLREGCLNVRSKKDQKTLRTVFDFAMSSVYQHPPGSLRGSNDDNSSGGTSNLFENPILEVFTCSGWVLLLFYCVLCKRTQQPNTTVGDRIRARAQANLERAQRQIEKEKQTPEERRKIVHESLRTKRVLSQNSKGVWTLGNIDESEDNAMTIDDDPIEKEFTASDNSEKDDDDDDDDDDEEEDHGGVICLEPFL